MKGLQNYHIGCQNRQAITLLVNFADGGESLNTPHDFATSRAELLGNKRKCDTDHRRFTNASGETCI
jgi:hypothetical protein